VRKDGTYGVSPSSSWAYSDLLQTNPTALGIFSLNELSRYRDAVVLNPLDGVEPTLPNLAAGTYPAAETLYLYANKSRIRSYRYQAFQDLVSISLGPKNTFGNDPGGWAFVQLDDTDRNASLADAKALKEFHF
jgi:hypothetical protein